MFSVGASSGQISIGAATALDFESPSDSGGNNVYNLTVQVTDGKTSEGNADTAVDDSVDVTIAVTDVNESPEFGSSDVEREVDENTPGGTNIGDPIVASDPESNALTYSLSGRRFHPVLGWCVDWPDQRRHVGPCSTLNLRQIQAGDNVYDLTVTGV